MSTLHFYVRSTAQPARLLQMLQPDDTVVFMGEGLHDLASVRQAAPSAAGLYTLAADQTGFAGVPALSFEQLATLVTSHDRTMTW